MVERVRLEPEKKKRKRGSPKGVLPPAAGMGRIKGSQNKFTKIIKDCIILAGEAVGDGFSCDLNRTPRLGEGGLLGYLTKVAMVDYKRYCQLIGRAMPLQVTGKDDNPVEVIYKTREEVLARAKERGLHVINGTYDVVETKPKLLNGGGNGKG